MPLKASLHSRTVPTYGDRLVGGVLAYNWDTEDSGEAQYFGHLAFEVDDIYAVCDRLMKAGAGQARQ